MPNMWVEPEEVVRHNNSRVYHAYKDGSISQPYRFHYTTDDCEEDEYIFDIRDLPVYDEKLEHADVLKQAIDQNLLRFPE